jgi:hypothetical protein
MKLVSDYLLRADIVLSLAAKPGAGELFCAVRANAGGTLTIGWWMSAHDK